MATCSTVFRGVVMRSLASPGKSGNSAWFQVLTMIMMIGLVPGCPALRPCADDGDCDDGLFCNGLETCSGAIGLCTPGTPPCGCDCMEGLDTCSECCDDTECEDGDACTDDMCVDGQCAGTPIDCDDDDPCTVDKCDQETGDCVNEWLECDDADACTVDHCVDGECISSPIDCGDGTICRDGVCSDPCYSDMQCDDGLFCTGPDTCNKDGLCVAAGEPCGEGEVCDEENDACIECLDDDDCPGERALCDGGECIEPCSCDTDADCDDGLLCNGVEMCRDCTCDAGDDPCAETDCGSALCGEGLVECQEGDAGPICVCATSASFFLTLGCDNLVGSPCDDVLSGALHFDPEIGGLTEALGDCDRIDGGDGIDTLNLTLTSASMVNPESVASIETINITDFGGATLNATNITGADTFNTLSSTEALTVSEIQEPADLGMINIQSVNVNMTMTFAQPGTTSGTEDHISLTMTNSIAGTATINTAGTSGFEVINLVSSGGSANTLSALAHPADSLAAANFEGEQDLKVQTMPASVLTYDASSMTGGLTLGGGSAVGSYTTFATVDLTGITGGSGDDMIIFAASLNGNDASQANETIDLGDGRDVVQATFGVSIGAQLPLLNVEELRFNATTSGISVDLGAVTGLTDVTIEQDGTTNTWTLFNVPGVENLNFRGDGTQAAQTYDGVTLAMNDAGGPSDTLTIAVHNRGMPLNATGTGSVHAIGAISAGNLEIIHLTVEDGPAEFSGINAGAMTTFIANAGSNLTLGTVGGGATTSVNLTGATGNLSGTFATMGDGGVVLVGNGTANAVSVAGSGGTTISITGGTGDDAITGSAQADVLSGGAGNDTILGGAGGDTLTGGSGRDIFDYVTATDSLSSALDTVTDFLSGRDAFDVANPPTNLGSGTAGADLAAGSTASTGTTAGTLAADIATVVAAAAENAFDQPGDTLVVAIMGASIGGSNAVFLVVENGTHLTTYDATEDLVVLLGGTSSTLLATSDFQ